MVMIGWERDPCQAGGWGQVHDSFLSSPSGSRSPVQFPSCGSSNALESTRPDTKNPLQPGASTKGVTYAVL